MENQAVNLNKCKSGNNIKTFEQVYDEIEKCVKNLEVEYEVEEDGIGTYEFWGSREVDYGSKWIEPKESVITVIGVDIKTANEVIKYSDDNYFVKYIAEDRFIGEVVSCVFTDTTTVDFYIHWEERSEF